MAINPLERYGIKEVADVTFYEINAATGKAAAPVLYLDTLKVSTIEQTAETAEARGGKGNPPLIIWDYGKEINVTLEDALFSAKSMSIMFSNGTVKTSADGGESTILKTVQFAGSTPPTQWEDAAGKLQPITTPTYYDAMTGAVAATTEMTSDGAYFATFTYAAVNPKTIEISAQNFPGTYYVTGDTYARSEVTGKDEYFQFIIAKAKMLAENTITLEAEGDPSVFNLNLRVMRPADKKMMKLVQYGVAE